MDPVKWTEDERNEVRLTLATRGWKDVMVPTLVHQVQQSMSQLLVNHETRPEPRESHDWWRGFTMGVQWGLHHWELRLAAAEAAERFKQEDADEANADTIRPATPYTEGEPFAVK